MKALALNPKPIITAHMMINEIFQRILPEHGLIVKEVQVQLSHDMLDALAGRKIALCDAGVGIGKTYAYLVAAIVQKLCLPEEWWVRTSYRHDSHFGMITPMPVVISTPSIALGVTICRVQIPFISRVLYQSDLLSQPVVSILRKGKGHYACDRRLRHRISNANLDKKNTIQREALLKLLNGNIDLDRAAHLSYYNRKRVSVPPSCDASCSGSGQCRYRNFLAMVMNPAIDIQVCNHHYLLADLYHRQTGKEPLLPNYRAVIVDEAYRLSDATRHMHIQQNTNRTIANRTVPMILISDKPLTEMILRP